MPGYTEGMVLGGMIAFSVTSNQMRIDLKCKAGDRPKNLDQEYLEKCVAYYKMKK